MAHGISARLSPAEGRKFGLTVGVAFSVLAAIAGWRGHAISMYVFGGLATTLLVAAVVAFVMGGVWYSPLLFGKAWLKLRGMDSAEAAGTQMGPRRFWQSSFEASSVFGGKNSKLNVVGCC